MSYSQCEKSWASDPSVAVMHAQSLFHTVHALVAGIYLNEHRNYGGSRRIVVTLQGKLRADGRNYGSNAW